jgi:hypothetical protein
VGETPVAIAPEVTGAPTVLRWSTDMAATTPLGLAPRGTAISELRWHRVVGPGMEFSERGVHELKGGTGEWELFSVAGN